MEMLFWGLGAIGFWIFIGIISIVLLALIEYERVGWATFFTVGTMVFCQFLTSFKPFSLIADHPLAGALVIVGYFLVGGLWAIWKWWFFVRAKLRDYRTARDEFLKRQNATIMTEDLLSKWQQSMPYDYRRGSEFGRPRAAKEKGRIMTWMCYWPWSFVWTIVNDPIKRAFRAIYDAIQGILETISKRAFREYEGDFVQETPRSDTEEN